MDVLPAINLRLTLARELFLRLAYSKQLSRPTFGQLSPIVTLNPGGNGQRTGSAGNPGLQPLKTDQFDVSLEHYFDPDNSIYAAGLYKNITGFVANSISTQVFDGISFQITRHNYQLSGFYDKHGIRANVNRVWRSRLLEATSADPRGRPDYRIPFGQLDANLLYQLTPRVALQISGLNLTQSLIRRSFQDARFFAQDAQENRRILAGFQIKPGGGI